MQSSIPTLDPVLLDRKNYKSQFSNQSHNSNIVAECCEGIKKSMLLFSLVF